MIDNIDLECLPYRCWCANFSNNQKTLHGNLVKCSICPEITNCQKVSRFLSQNVETHSSDFFKAAQSLIKSWKKSTYFPFKLFSELRHNKLDGDLAWTGKWKDFYFFARQTSNVDQERSHRLIRHENRRERVSILLFCAKWNFVFTKNCLLLLCLTLKVFLWPSFRQLIFLST